MLHLVHGNLLEHSAEAHVNTVNCKGVMGKGIALQFKEKYPKMFRKYRKLCKDGILRPGVLHIHNRESPPKYIINFPTKDHWKYPSQLRWIDFGLRTLAVKIQEKNIRSIAIPALGCSNGGLDWENVRPLIEKHLAEVSKKTEVFLFEPHEN